MALFKIEILYPFKTQALSCPKTSERPIKICEEHKIGIWKRHYFSKRNLS